MTKTTITRNEFLQLEGILALAKRLQDQAAELKAAACELTGEDAEEWGHTSDAVYSDGTTAAQLIKKMGIKVLKG